MTAQRLDGAAPSREVEAELARAIERIRGRVPTLAAVAADQDPLAIRFLDLKQAAFRRTGMELRPLLVPQELTTRGLLDRIDALNSDPEVDGIFLQYPLPPAVDSRASFDRVSCAKDVDGASNRNVGKLASGEPLFVPATPAAMLHLLARYEISLTGLRAVVVGPSMIASLTSILLLQAGAAVRLCDIRDPGTRAAIATAELLIAATGERGAISGEWIGDGAVVVDAGYDHGGTEGDIAIGKARERVSAFVPARGGLGPLTVAMLLRNTLLAWERRHSNENGSPSRPTLTGMGGDGQRGRSRHIAAPLPEGGYFEA